MKGYGSPRKLVGVYENPRSFLERTHPNLTHGILIQQFIASVFVGEG